MPKTPQEVVNAAYSYMMSVMSLQAGKISNPRVEEMVPIHEANQKGWNVVISYDIAGDFAFEKMREYKEFKVSEEGTVLEMKIKKI